MHGKTRTIYTSRQDQGNRRRNMIRSWIILIVVVLVAGVVVSSLLRNPGAKTDIAYSTLPCYPDQDVTPFGDNVLYYDNSHIHCLTSTGAIRWSFPVGEGASFSVSDTHIVAWSGPQMRIINSSGISTFDQRMDETVQFARVGGNYAAIVMGPDTDPALLITDLRGNEIDYEKDAFADKMMMDVGFYGEQGQYLWTLCMDVYGLKLNTVLNTFQVGKMNTGSVSLGEKLVYKVLFENKRLRVFTTQQLYTYDYKAVQNAAMTKLVYGWQLIDAGIPARGDAYMLLTPIAQVSGTPAIRELRLISGDSDRRLALLKECVGAVIYGNSIYGFNSENIYRSNVNEQRFYSYEMPIKGTTLTGFLGMCSDGRALLTDGSSVFSVSVPK